LDIIFNSSNPTGGDLDLGTPHQDFGGPGIGVGGANNQPGENNVSHHCFTFAGGEVLSAKI